MRGKRTRTALQADIVSASILCPESGQVVSLDDDDFYIDYNNVTETSALIVECLCGKDHIIFSVEA